jgi:hypothetical protein
MCASMCWLHHLHFFCGPLQSLSLLFMGVEYLLESIALALLDDYKLIALLSLIYCYRGW